MDHHLVHLKGKYGNPQGRAPSGLPSCCTHLTSLAPPFPCTCSLGVLAAGNRNARIIITVDWHIKRYFCYGSVVKHALDHFKKYLRSGTPPAPEQGTPTFSLPNPYSCVYP